MSFRFFPFLFASILASLSAQEPPKHSAPGHKEDIGQGDPICYWIDHPDKRDSKLHLAFVEVVSVAEERLSFTNASNAAVSDDGGKTWYSLMRVRTGLATLKVIECPDIAMPATVTVRFESRGYIPTRDTPWKDRRVQPTNRLLGFFRKEGGGNWSLERLGFSDPVDYLLTPSYANRLHALFKTQLADQETVAKRRRELDEAAERARRDATTSPPSDPIDVLARRLNSQKPTMWINGEYPKITLSSNATPQQVVSTAVAMWGFNEGHIKTFRIREIRKVELGPVTTNCSAALIESDLGKKILLFRYDGTDWWTRFYDASQ